MQDHDGDVFRGLDPVDLILREDGVVAVCSLSHTMRRRLETIDKRVHPYGVHAPQMHEPAQSNGTHHSLLGDQGPSIGDEMALLRCIVVVRVFHLSDSARVCMVVFYL